MHNHDLRLVAIRFIDQFKNIGYKIKVQSVHYKDDVPVGFCDPRDPEYILKQDLPHLGPELPQNINELYVKTIIERTRISLNRYFDDKQAACSLPVLIFPDDFQDGVNLLSESA